MKENKTELKPCPFCGGEARLKQIVSSNGEGRFIEVWRVQCHDCDATFNRYGFESIFYRNDEGEFIFEKDGRAEAVEVWNKRAFDYETANKVSRFLQDSGYEEASKAVDCAFDL